MKGTESFEIILNITGNSLHSDSKKWFPKLCLEWLKKLQEDPNSLQIHVFWSQASLYSYEFLKVANPTASIPSEFWDHANVTHFLQKDHVEAQFAEYFKSINGNLRMNVKLLTQEQFYAKFHTLSLNAHSRIFHIA
jgi:hypothetical protein